MPAGISDGYGTDDPVVPVIGYTLTLNPNYSGGICEMYTDVKTMTLPSMTHGDNTFKGWSLTADGAVVYRAGDPITLTSNLTLYAVWSGTESGDYPADGD